jgi:hypothetical protein
MYSGKFLDYSVKRTIKKDKVYWSIKYYLGEKGSNTQTSKKLNLTDHCGVISKKNTIISTSAVTSIPLNPKLISENLIDSEDNLYFINSWLVDNNKISSGDVISLIQIYNNQYYGTRVKVSSTRPK